MRRLALLFLLPLLLAGCPRDRDADGYTSDIDCDDDDPDVHPGRVEACDGRDTDCDGALAPEEVDDDGDAITECQGDCDDGDAGIFFGAPEGCDALDTDCDGAIPATELDDDGDGLSDCAGDCDDADPAVHPGAVEGCDGLDTDCDGAGGGDETDDDGDGLSECDGDCDDTEPLIHPVAVLVGAGIDTDCDGAYGPDETDDDGDGVTECLHDCDDANFAVHPGADEGCDGLDTDCDGQLGPLELDDDGDGVSECDGDCDDADGAFIDWEPIALPPVLVDDFEPDEGWSRLGTDRWLLGTVTPAVGDGTAEVTLTEGWSGVMTGLMHTGDSHAGTVDPQALLGPWILPAYQVSIAGIEVDVAGDATIGVELKDASNAVLFADTATVAPAAGLTTLTFPTAPTDDVKFVTWLVDGAGTATVHEVRLLTASTHDFTAVEAGLLFSYAQLSRNWDPATGWLRDRSIWPASAMGNVPAMGTFALATALMAELGYVDPADAVTVVGQTRQALLELPLQADTKLLPHFIADGALLEGTEWSTIDSAIAWQATGLALELLGGDTAEIGAAPGLVDWDLLSVANGAPITTGLDEDGAKLPSSWDAWGGEAFVVGVAAAPGLGVPLLDFVDPSDPMTWSGSGFIDELGALLFDMQGVDAWGVDWSVHRQAAWEAQVAWVTESDYVDLGLVGVSASEVPEPWAVADGDPAYGGWGIGGFGAADDGSLHGTGPIVAPHWAMMVGAEHPGTLDRLVRGLAEAEQLFTPMNNVESIRLDDDGTVRWNHLKGSWNLGLQTLGAARAAYACTGEAYPVYELGLWSAGLGIMIP